jgi:Protein of unknown function (DUF1488)
MACAKTGVTMRISFPRAETKTPLSDPIQFFAIEGKRRIVCKISHAALHYADRDAADKEPIQALWNRYIDFAEDVAARRIELGYFESDGSVVVRDDDLERVRRESLR